MCLRLFGAISGRADAAGLAFRAGLDLRPDPRPIDRAAGAQVLLVELSWGDCACALATSADGGERLAVFAEGLFAAGARLQLLLLDELDDPRFGSLPVNTVALSTIRSQGLSALDRGAAAEVSEL